ncbi:hypothetical protein ACS0PU_013120 [Formica fusca]
MCPSRRSVQCIRYADATVDEGTDVSRNALRPSDENHRLAIVPCVRRGGIRVFEVVFG